ncbi:MAG: ParA family protein [Methylacidiphilales bacterium]|nr:ParA family protein [Candidatus Methylacidiphilales bacterium]
MVTKMTNSPFGSITDKLDRSGVPALVHAKHPGSICIINYKGGVGKTTVTALLGIYLAQVCKKRVLLFDIDPQCSLSLALGFDPERISKGDSTVFNLVEPAAWVKKKRPENYAQRLKSPHLPRNLDVVPGSFRTDELDYIIAKTLLKDEKRYLVELFLYMKQLLMSFEQDYDYVLIDCPPNKMFLTQAMLRACSYYLPVTIPDQISIYGMPRLIRWVCEIDPPADRPRFLGYVLNALTRAGGSASGTTNQQGAQVDLLQNVRNLLDSDEQKIVSALPTVGGIPRLDVIARFLGANKSAFQDFKKSTSGQKTVDACLTGIRNTVIDRIQKFQIL